MIGTTSALLAYDVENNQDLFYRDVPDGVNVCASRSDPRDSWDVEKYLQSYERKSQAIKLYFIFRFCGPNYLSIRT